MSYVMSFDHIDDIVRSVFRKRIDSLALHRLRKIRSNELRYSDLFRLNPLETVPSHRD